MNTKSDIKMNMIHGPLLIKILKFAFPIIMGSVMQQLFSAVDIAVAGNAIALIFEILAFYVVTGTAAMTALFVVWRQLKKEN